MKKVNFKLKKQVIFNCISILFVLSVGFYFLGRFIYYKLESEKPIIYSDFLAEHLIEIDYGNNYGMESDLVNVNGIYRYVGDAKYNYVKYKGFIWRVVKINSDNTVTLITQDAINSLSYSNSLKSDILAWLNSSDEINTGIFEASLEDNNNELLPTKICMDSFGDLEIASCFDTTNNYKIGILSVYDYIEANANNSYLNNGDIFWTSNSFNESNAWFIAEDGRLGYDRYNSKYGIRPTITLSGDHIIYSGNGSADDPYILTNEIPTTLNDIYIGSYLTFNNSMWKVVSKNEEGIKIVSEECLKDNTGECLLSNYSLHSNQIDIKGDELMGYLNKTYYNSLQNKEFVVLGKFYTGTYSLIDNNYRNCFDYSQNLYVGFLSIAELFASELENTFLMTTSPYNDLSIYSVSSSHGFYENMVTEQLNIRPSLYLNSNITILNGNGTYLSPYTLGGLQ